ncbi:hypothetical protein AB0B50_43095 [Streptomyces sp. NPDC041068]|uniref:hypothetical protein n=1 Tax=Streptomyces sp. NPDC041068 TaxID=3155130 RepID=UPI0033ECE20C
MNQDQQESAENSPGPEEDYLVDFDLNGDWLDLTLHKGTQAEARQLAMNLVEQFNPLSLDGGKAALQQELERRALTAYESGPLLAVAAYTTGGAFLADLSVLAYGEDDVPRPSPEEYRHMLLKWSYAEVKGEAKVTDVELPIGPAVRVQAVLAEKRRFGWGKKLSECLRYWVWPDGMEEIVLVEARWLNFERADELTELVDRLMPTMRFLPVPAESGTDHAPESPSEP